MIKTGNILMVSGATAAILSACGYDGQPVIGGIVFLIGLALLGTGNIHFFDAGNIPYIDNDTPARPCKIFRTIFLDI